MKKLISFLKPYKLQLAVGPFFKLTEAVFELLIPTLMAMIIDNGVNAGNQSYVVRMGAIMLAIATFGVVSALICQYSASIASQGFGTDVRNSMYKKIETLSFADLDKFGTSSLVNRITGDVNQLQQAVAMLIRLVIRAPFLCVGGLVMVMLIDIKLSVIFMIVIPLFVFVLFLVMFKAVPLYKSVQKKLDKMTLVLRENLSGVRVIRAFAGRERERERFSEANTDFSETAIRVGKIAALTNPATTVIMNFAIIAVIQIGGIRVNSGSLSQGQIIAFINYLTQILNAMIVVANLVILYTKAYTSAGRVGEVLSYTPSLSDTEKEIVGVKGAPCVEFKNVTMTYPSSTVPSLENINLRIEEGETVGVIGGTGSGKSTLVNLMTRFYAASTGEVLLNGVNVKEYPQKQLRHIIAIVQQRANLFTGTIAHNLRMGKADATKEDMDKACRIAQASEFVDRLPNRYETEISQSGNNLSGGQKQRITIARALIKEAPILIMDDSASALDFATDAKLRRAIKEDTVNKTVIIVSQRVNTVKDTDKIIVLDDGKIVGTGTHTELLETCDVYKEICVSQEQM